MLMSCGPTSKVVLLAMLVVAVAVVSATDPSGDVGHGEFSMNVPSSAAPQHATSGGPSLIRRHDYPVTSENPLLRREANSTSWGSAFAEVDASADPKKEQVGEMAQPVQMRKIAPFDTYDSDKSGVLEKEEAHSFMSAMGVPKSMFQHIAEHDGSIDKVVFERLQSDTDVFAAGDSDGSGFLEANEITAIMMRAGITQVEFDWHAFDFNKDGKLSKSEFLASGPSAANAVAMSSHSLLQEWSDEDPEGLLSEEEDPDNSMASLLEQDSGDEAGHDADMLDTWDEDADWGDEADDAHREDDLWVMKDADKDGSSFLEIGEIGDLIHNAGIATDFDWKAYDADQDGKLSKEEWFNAAEVVKQQASSEFRNTVRRNIGEADEPDVGVEDA